MPVLTTAHASQRPCAIPILAAGSPPWDRRAAESTFRLHTAAALQLAGSSLSSANCIDTADDNAVHTSGCRSTAVGQLLEPTSRHGGSRPHGWPRLHKGLQRRPIRDDEAALDVPELCSGARDDEVKEHRGGPRDVPLTVLQPAVKEMKMKVTGPAARCQL